MLVVRFQVVGSRYFIDHLPTSLHRYPPALKYVQTSQCCTWPPSTLLRPLPPYLSSFTYCRYFADHPPTTSLPLNYVYPEPPSDRAWALSGKNFKKAFPPKTYNLGGRKWMSPREKMQRIVSDFKYKVRTS